MIQSATMYVLKAVRQTARGLKMAHGRRFK